MTKQETWKNGKNKENSMEKRNHRNLKIEELNLKEIEKPDKKEEKNKTKKNKKKERHRWFTILNQALTHGENQEFKGQVLSKMIQRLKFLTPTQEILTFKTLVNYEIINQLKK